jgi:DNA-binding Xre family transcriptional regulator
MVNQIASKSSESEGGIVTGQQELVAIRVTLNEHLRHLAGIEAVKLPSQQRRVPTLTELAESIGVHRVTVTNLANNRARHLNLDTMNAVLNELRRRGFNSNLSDILQAYPVSEIASAR